MLDTFIIRALIAAVLLMLAAAPLGCFVVWRRMAYFGDALSHAALLGIALGLAVNIPIQIGIVAICIVFAIAIYALQRRKTLSNDTLLGILAHTTLAYGLIGLALMPDVRIDLHSVLFGDILSVTNADLYWIGAGSALVLAVLCFVWQKLLLTTLSEDLAKAEGINTNLLQVLLLLCLTITVAVAIQVVGVLLVTSMLIIPAATARYFATSPHIMALMTACIGIIGTISGLYASVIIDVPTGPAMVAALASLFFVIAGLTSFRRR